MTHMTRFRRLESFILGMLVVWLLSALVASAAEVPRATFLPTVLGGQHVAVADDSTCSDSEPLHNRDTGLLTATYNATEDRYVVAYQDRAGGGRAHVVEHRGSRLVEVAAVAPVAPVGIEHEPSFSPPGPKQGDLALVYNPNKPAGQQLRLYYTQRKIGDTTGPYGIWCKDF